MPDLTPEEKKKIFEGKEIRWDILFEMAEAYARRKSHLSYLRRNPEILAAEFLYGVALGIDRKKGDVTMTYLSQCGKWGIGTFLSYYIKSFDDVFCLSGDERQQWQDDYRAVCLKKRRQYNPYGIAERREVQRIVVEEIYNSRSEVVSDVLYMRLIKQMSLREIGEKHNVTKQWINQLVDAEMPNLRSRLSSRGIGADYFNDKKKETKMERQCCMCYAVYEDGEWVPCEEKHFDAIHGFCDDCYMIVMDDMADTLEVAGHDDLAKKCRDNVAKREKKCQN